MSVIEFVITQIVGEPAILFGIIALLGLLFLRKPIEDIILGVTKTIIGFLILLAGAEVLSAVIAPFAEWINIILGVDGVQPTMWAVLSTGLAEYGTAISFAVILGFALNLILARITPLKGIHITGHIMLLFAAWVITYLAGFGFSGTSLILLGGLICGLQYWLSPSIIRPFMAKRITSEWSLCMPNVFGIVMTAWLSPIFGKPKDSTEDVEVPKRLSWIRDSIVSIAVFGTILWFILGLLAGPEVVQKAAGDQHWAIFLIILGIRFAAGVAVILHGVRMLLAEIVPAFQGIANNLIPGAVMGLDYPTIFRFAPTGMFIGFFGKLFGACVGTLLAAVFNFPAIVLPSVFMDFWDGAIMGVFADRYGGRRAVFIVPFVLGIVIQLIWCWAYPFTGEFLISGAMAMDYPDTGILSLIFNLIIGIFQ